MPHLSAVQQSLIGLALALFMIVTRSPQLPVPELLHSGSWAVFLAAGVYLGSNWALPAFLGLAFALDAAALGWGGVVAYCFTPAYGMLIPAYGCLWAAGRWYASHHRLNLATLAPLAAAVVVGGLACEAFSSASFYWLSGQFAAPSLAEFAAREARYFPAYLATLAFWTTVIAFIHVAVATRAGTRAIETRSA